MTVLDNGFLAATFFGGSSSESSSESLDKILSIESYESSSESSESSVSDNFESALIFLSQALAASCIYLAFVKPGWLTRSTFISLSMKVWYEFFPLTVLDLTDDFVMAFDFGLESLSEHLSSFLELFLTLVFFGPDTPLFFL
ncbi:putative ORFan [Tupanvirus deep ocean]|uniref:ORFan n=2 Tax=Tupanvirus TaxID=2094720 RepID=A0AC62A813_9VIRU|nr:putative ORFan [Tupanvirus deep ocean]QKU33859.1 putative ORFan [Tupanvirus deep ocean]